MTAMHPAWLFLLLIVPILLFRRRSRYSVPHPSAHLLRRFEEKRRGRLGVRLNEARKNWPRLAAALALFFYSAAIAGFALSTLENRIVERGRIGVIALDDSGSTMMARDPISNLRIIDSLILNTSRFAVKWCRDHPIDKLGFVSFASGSLPLGAPTCDAEKLVWRVQNMSKLNTNFSGSTEMGRGLFAVLFMLLPERSDEEVEKLASVLKRHPKSVKEIKHLLPEIEGWRRDGKFFIAATDGIVELKSETDIPGALLLIELMGELGMVPYIVTPDEAGEAREALTKLARKYGGKDYYLRNLRSDGLLAEVVKDISFRVAPAPRDEVSETKWDSLAWFSALLAFGFFLAWLVGMTRRKQIPFFVD